MNRSHSKNALWVCSIPGRSAYRPLWELQRRLWRARHAGAVPDTLLLLEHDPVITLGRNARREHLLRSEAEYTGRGIEVVDVDRGGDVTYHGPGQLVGYYIFDLRAWRLDLGAYLREIEGVLMDALRRWDIQGDRSPGATGVWVGPAKIAAIGLHMSRWVSTHGFALNRCADLDPFDWIVPCGLHGRPVTSMERELKDEDAGRQAPARAAVEREVIEATERRFERAATRRSRAAIEHALSEFETGNRTPAVTVRPANQERNGACLV